MESATDTIEGICLFTNAGGAECGIEETDVTIEASYGTDTMEMRSINESIRAIAEPYTRSKILHGNHRTIDYIHANPYYTRKGNTTQLKETVWAIYNINPLAFTIEISPEIKTEEKIKKPLTEKLAKREYKTQVITLNAVNYGVPQNRTQLFIIGIKKSALDTANQEHTQLYPNSQYGKQPGKTLTGQKIKQWTTAKEALDDLPLDTTHPQRPNLLSPRKHPTPEQHNTPHRKTNNQHYYHILANNIPKKHNKDKQVEFANTDHLTDPEQQYPKRLHQDKPAPDLSANKTTVPIHYKGKAPTNNESELPRKITPRECARLQTFPDTHVFLGTKTKQYKMVKQSSPPLVQYFITNHVTKLL